MSAFYEIIARYYDAEVGDKVDDLQLYSRLAEQYHGPILDIGCGTGRVLLHLAQEGYSVHGIDDSAAMLARLERRLQALPHLRDTLTYTQADVLAWETEQQFGLILLSYNALMHFHTQAQQITLLTRLRSWLAPDGCLIIDLPNAGEVFATQETDAVLLDRTFIEPETGHMVMVQSTSYLDRVTQLLDVRWIYDEVDGDGVVKRLVVPHMLRYFFFAEMQLLLERCGLQVDAVYGDADEQPFEDSCERMIIFAKPI